MRPTKSDGAAAGSQGTLWQLVDISSERAREAEVVRGLESKLGLPFTRYLSRLRAMNRWTESELIISP